MTKDCSGRVTPKRVPGACSWRQAGERLALLPGAHRAAYAGHGSASNSGFFFCCGSSRRMKPNKTHSHLLSTNFWDRFTKVTGKFPSAVQSVCVICCRHVHITSCQKVSTRCLYCLYCLSLGKCKKRAMHLL